MVGGMARPEGEPRGHREAIGHSPGAVV